MSAVTEVIQQCHRAGLTLRVADGCIRVRPRSRLTPELADAIKAHKPEILDALTETLRRGRNDAASRARCARSYLDPRDSDRTQIRHLRVLRTLDRQLPLRSGFTHVRRPDLRCGSPDLWVSYPEGGKLMPVRSNPKLFAFHQAYDALLRVAFEGDRASAARHRERLDRLAPTREGDDYIQGLYRPILSKYTVIGIERLTRDQ